MAVAASAAVRHAAVPYASWPYASSLGPAARPPHRICWGKHLKGTWHEGTAAQQTAAGRTLLPPLATPAAAARPAANAAELPLLLAGVRVVLVSPKTPANIGAVLRVAENFEAHDVVVVDPRCDPRCGEVAKTSCFSPLQDSLRVVPTLADALADSIGSIGFTRRSGAGRNTVHASLAHLLARFPGAIPALLPGMPQRAEGTAGEETTAAEDAAALAPTVALVFGREESGLLESELNLCSHASAIPTGRSQPSLNLSHAVSVVLSQLFDVKQQRLMMHLDGPSYTETGAVTASLAEASEQRQWQPEQEQRPGPAPGLPATAAAASGLRGSLFEDESVQWRREQALAAASQAELEALLSRAAALLESSGISAELSAGGGNNSNHGRKKKLMGHVRALLLRSQASTAEVRALHGLCKELEGRQLQQADRQLTSHD